MSSKHLTTGSQCPPLAEGKVRIYNMKYCPFAQRTLLVAEAKSIPFEIVNVNLTNKPEWLFEKNAEGKVPVLETNDGKILSESLIVADYIDEAYPSQRKLHPTDPYQKAQNRILLEKYGSSVIPCFYKILFAIRDKEDDASKKEKIESFVKALKPIEEALTKRGTLFFGGNDKPGMLDYMIWPWMERVPVIKAKLPDLFDYESAKKENPSLERWREAMKKDNAVAKVQPPEGYLEFIESYLSGNTKYD